MVALSMAGMTTHLPKAGPVRITLPPPGRRSAQTFSDPLMLHRTKAIVGMTEAQVKGFLMRRSNRAYAGGGGACPDDRRVVVVRAKPAKIRQL